MTTLVIIHVTNKHNYFNMEKLQKQFDNLSINYDLAVTELKQMRARETKHLSKTSDLQNRLNKEKVINLEHKKTILVLEEQCVKLNNVAVNLKKNIVEQVDMNSKLHNKLIKRNTWLFGLSLIIVALSMCVWFCSSKII